MSETPTSHPELAPVPATDRDVFLALLRRRNVTFLEREPTTDKRPGHASVFVPNSGDVGGYGFMESEWVFDAAGTLVGVANWE